MEMPESGQCEDQEQDLSVGDTGRISRGSAGWRRMEDGGGGRWTTKRRSRKHWKPGETKMHKKEPLYLIKSLIHRPSYWSTLMS